MSYNINSLSRFLAPLEMTIYLILQISNLIQFVSTGIIHLLKKGFTLFETIEEHGLFIKPVKIKSSIIEISSYPSNHCSFKL